MTIDRSFQEKLSARQEARAAAGEAASSGGGGGPHDPNVERRLSSLEAGVQDLKVVLGRLEPLIVRVEEWTGHLASKEDVANVRADLASKAGRGTIWTAGATFLALVIGAASLGAAYVPYVATLLRKVER